MGSDKARAAFVDRDGTLIAERDFLTEKEDIEILPHTVEAIRLLRELGYLVVVVSNQSGVARGYLTERRVFEINEEVFRQLEERDARPDLFFYCPHHPDATIVEYRSECECRKPGPGLVKMAQQIIDIDIAKSVSIGDKLSDVQLCQNLGGRGILVLTGYGAAERDRIEPSGIEPDFVADTVLDAVRWLEKSLVGG